MIQAVLLAALTSLTFDDGHLSFSIPSNMQVRRRQMNFETWSYDVIGSDKSTPLLTIIDGGGSYTDADGSSALDKYTKICLNGMKAWQFDKGDSAITVVGNAGFWSVSAEYANLSGERLAIAKAIVASIRFDVGPKC